MFATMKLLSHTLVPTALGLLVALLALCLYRYFEIQLDRFEGELRLASFELLTNIARKG